MTSNSGLRTAAALALGLGFGVVLGGAARADDRLSVDANAAYLAKNAKAKGVVVVPGIQYRVIRSGSGAQPARHDCVTVTYKGSLINGTVFDETKGNDTATFGVSDVIGGWTEVLQLMHEGDDWEVTIPSGLAYGKSGTPGGEIPPNQTLIFEINLQKVFPAPMGGCG
ncbi:MAG TPA: FKBP-type peptidyl-prolyl cis-trans isomerase [Rhizomicrobium sp.]|jgi:FKBP-type peptidyl-prolyl cis-trans isomerase|nr:FKBP-type peptidyl-prolyl cis-trans isomerase [Rhizomicrobium sp.]